MAAKVEAINMVLLGRTGNGKSATGNSILGWKAFTSKARLSSVTDECKLESCVTKDGLTLNVIDTPGLFDTDKEASFMAKEIVRCIQLAKDGLHAVLYVTSIDRFTPEEAKVIDALQALFGHKIVDYMIVVFTGGDKLEKDNKTLEEYLQDNPKGLEELLHRCCSRKVLFDNRTNQTGKKEEQRTKLLYEIDNIISKNGGQPYSNDIFHQFQKLSARVSGQKEEAESYKRKSEGYKRDAEEYKREAYQEEAESYKREAEGYKREAYQEEAESYKREAEGYKRDAEEYKREAEICKITVEMQEKQIEQQAELYKTSVKEIEEKIKSLSTAMWVTSAVKAACTLGGAAATFCTIL